MKIVSGISMRRGRRVASGAPSGAASGITALIASASISLAAGIAGAQTAPTAAPSSGMPYIYHSWLASLYSPGPASLAAQGIGAVIPASELDANAFGLLGTYQPGGATTTATNAFFQSLGTNGRSCATCHQPASGMSVSLADIQARYVASGAKDPIFAPVDGAVCPSAVPAAYTSPSILGKRRGGGKSLASAYSLILTRGVFRIFLPVPADADFTISVLSDPTGCNTNPLYNQVTDPTTGLTTQIISVYRRPLISSNLKFKTIVLGDTIDFNNGADPLDPTQTPDPIDPTTGLIAGGNIMWDGRELDLSTQAVDATLSHAQATAPPTTAQVAEMVAFENGIYSAQQYRSYVGSLSTNGALGGPVNLYDLAPGNPASLTGGLPTFFTSYSTVTGSTAAELLEESIYRGQVIFNTRPINITYTAGLTNIPFFPGTGPASSGNLIVGNCAICHNQAGSGNDAFQNAQHDLGVSGDLAAFGGPSPATDLPIFVVTCNAGAPTAYHSSVIYTNDPTRALISGKCADVGRSTVPQLRALASHPPYFHDGSAASLLAVVNFYAKRFGIVYSAQDKIDLVNYLASL